jgi:hypothetical protein
MRTITDTEIAATLARVDLTLRHMGVPTLTGACQCGRCTRSGAPRKAADASEPPAGPSPPPVANPAPAPSGPLPGGIAVPLPRIPSDEGVDAIMRSAQAERALLSRHSRRASLDRIAF